MVRARTTLLARMSHLPTISDNWAALYPRLRDFQTSYIELQQSLEDPQEYQIKLLKQEVRCLRDDLAKEINEHLQTQIVLNSQRDNRKGELEEENIRLKNELAEMQSQIVLHNEPDNRTLKKENSMLRAKLERTIANAAQNRNASREAFRKVDRQKQDLKEEKTNLQRELNILNSRVNAPTRAVQSFGSNRHFVLVQHGSLLVTLPGSSHSGENLGRTRSETPRERVY